ncbi:MAG: c-type cytochrome [Caulobacterales bacterium]
MAASNCGRRGRILLVATLVAAGLAVQARAQVETPPEARGHALVARNCGMCHAIEKVGDSPNPEAPPFRRLHERYPVENLGEALAEGILVGHPQMPEFRFGGGEISDIIAYLKSIQTYAHAQAIRHAGPAALLRQRLD